METATSTSSATSAFAAFGRKCGVAEGSSVRLTCPPNEWFPDRPDRRPGRSDAVTPSRGRRGRPPGRPGRRC
jgi:hypothetical protein